MTTGTGPAPMRPHLEQSVSGDGFQEPECSGRISVTENQNQTHVGAQRG